MFGVCDTLMVRVVIRGHYMVVVVRIKIFPLYLDYLISGATKALTLVVHRVGFSVESLNQMTILA